MRYLLSLLAITLVSGCASGPSGAGTPLLVRSDAATITFLRPFSAPALYSGTVLIDGTEVGSLGCKCYAVIYVNPGHHEVKFTFPLLAMVESSSISITCEPNASYYVSYLGGLGSIGYGAFVTSHLKEMTEAEGKAVAHDFKHAFTHGEKEPNKDPVPTPKSVTSAADAPVAPAAAAAHQ